MKRPIYSSRNKGFSLLQIATILMVSTVVLISILPGQDAGDINQKNINNTQKLDKVEDAMMAFMALNGRRPCPADGQFDVNTRYFGIEAYNPASPGTCTGATVQAPLGPNNNVVGGTIPTKTLGLPDDYAFDAWGRRFTYVVDARATVADTTGISGTSCAVVQNYPVNNGAGHVQVQYKDNTGAIVQVDNTMYAYVSHGPDGHGAWPEQGITGPWTPAQSLTLRINNGSTDADTDINASVLSDGSFNTSFTNVRVKKDKTATFDDLVYYRNAIKNTCCIGASCMTAIGFRADGAGGAGVLTGEAVAVGDVNGDGISDIVIAQPGSNATAGGVYVLFGQKSGGFASPFALSGLNGTGGFIVNGATAGDKIAYSVAIGDVNGDGIGDIIVGTQYANGAKGSVFVLFGHTGSWGNTPYTFNNAANTGIVSSTNPTSRGFQINGVTASANTAVSVSVGDINGDGYSDIIIGAPGLNSNKGGAYVVFGNATSFWSAHSSVWTLDATGSGLIDGTHGFEIDGEGATEAVGTSVATGDINGDGFADIILGAPGANSGAGSVYVVFGKNTSWAGGPFKLDSTAGDLLDGTKAFRVDAAGTDTTIGTAVASGDINGDGIQDLIIGAPSADSLIGSVFVVFGHTGTTWVWPNASSGGWVGPSANGIWTLDNGAAGLIVSNYGLRINNYVGGSSDKFGSVLAVGDINGDGVQDVIIGAPGAGAQFSRSTAGAAYVVFGSTASPPSWPAGVGNLNGTNGFVVEGSTAAANTGTSVAAGDINGDGKSDIVLGAPSLGTSGSSYIIYGQPSWSSAFDLHGNL